MVEFGLMQASTEETLQPIEVARFAEEQVVEIPEATGVLPAGMEGNLAWPEVLRDGDRIREVIVSEGRGPHPVLWSDYANEQGWDEKRPKAAFNAGKIRNQMFYGIICLVLAAGAGFILLRTMSRQMKVDDEAFYPAGGGRIPFEDIVRIDKRKWDTKGLATLTYRDSGGAEKPAKVDGMIYGQFREEDGAPAQALFERIMANFSGELVDLEPDEPPGSGEEGSAGKGE